MPEINIPRDDFSKFIESLKLIVNSNCTDCDIEKGRIRQKTNDSYSVIEMDLTSIIGENTIIISGAKQRVDLFKTFEVDDNVTVEDEVVKLETTESQYQLIDSFSKISWRIPIRKMLDNSYVSDEKFKNAQVSEEDLLLEYEFSPYLAKRTRQISEILNNDMITCHMNNGTANFKISEANKNNECLLIDNISLNKESSGKSSFLMYVLPFKMDVNSHIMLRVYKLNDKVLLCKSDLELLNSIPISVYTTVKITNG